MVFDGDITKMAEGHRTSKPPFRLDALKLAPSDASEIWTQDQCRFARKTTNASSISLDLGSIENGLIPADDLRNK